MSGKRFVAVICEYNPFHFGHKHQINVLKSEFDGVVCILSGNIVQRGSVAVADKYLRAEAALKSGANLVLELPVPWCCSSARDFANAGVSIARETGVHALAFGAESELSLLLEIKRATESDGFEKALTALTDENRNLSYPQAMTLTIEKTLGQEYAEAFKMPNNILALEYLRALDGSGISPFAVKRESGFLSSSQIRACACGEEMLALLPPESEAVFRRELNKQFPRDAKKSDSFFVGRARQMLYGESRFDGLYSVTDDLARKILLSSLKQSTADGIVSACTDKNYTSARVRRALNSLVFGIKAEQVHRAPPYTTVLATDATGREILRSAKKNVGIDIVNKPVRALELGEETKSAFLFAKYIEDILALSDPVPLPADTAKNPIVIGEGL